MSSQVKDKLISVFVNGIIMWLLLNTWPVLVSAIDNKNCNTEFNRRIEYVFPGNIVGCWAFKDRTALKLKMEEAE